MTYEGFRQKTPDELKHQDELLQLTEIMTESENVDHPTDYADRMRVLRQHVRPEDEEAELERLREMADERIAAGIEYLVRNGEFIAEGNYGIVYQVNIENLPRPQRRLLAYKGIDVEGAGEDTAAKILKIAHPGMAQDEYRRLQRAYDIVRRAEHSEDEQYARVPRPIGFLSDVKTNETTRSVLSAQSRKSKFDTATSEMLFMERIEGKDLASALYEFVLLRTGMTPNVIEQMSFQDMMMEVGGRLHFSLPGGKSWDEAARHFEERVLLRENADKLMAFLKKYRTDPELPISRERLSAIENTLHLFHDDGFGHNDLHERNVMIGNDGSVYLIDYGRLDADATSDDAIVKRYHTLLNDEMTSAQRTAEAIKKSEKLIPDNEKSLKNVDSLRDILVNSRDERYAVGRLVNYLESGTWTMATLAGYAHTLFEDTPEDDRERLRERFISLMTVIAHDSTISTRVKNAIQTVFHISPRYGSTVKNKAHPKVDAPRRASPHRGRRNS